MATNQQTVTPLVYKDLGSSEALVQNVGASTVSIIYADSLPGPADRGFALDTGHGITKPVNSVSTNVFAISLRANQDATVAVEV